MQKPSKSAERLLDLIKKAMSDGQLTTTEYDRIIMLADEDGVIDAQEKKLLSELQEMLSNGTIERVKG